MAPGSWAGTHAEAIAAAGGTPVLADVRGEAAKAAATAVAGRYGVPAVGVAADVTSEASVIAMLQATQREFGRVDILVNNAARNPRVENAADAFTPLERFSLDEWQADLAVGLTGAFLCAKVIGSAMAAAGRGVIINISSEYGIIAPDQRLYQKAGEPADRQPKKPVSYSVVKAGLHGLTLYLATYWADGWSSREYDLALAALRTASRRSSLTAPLPAFRWAAWHCRTNSRGRWSTLRPMRRPSSPGRISWWMAARACGSCCRLGSRGHAERESAVPDEARRRPACPAHKPARGTDSDRSPSTNNASSASPPTAVAP